MNGRQLPVHCFVTATEQGTPDFKPLDMRQWMGYTEQVKAREHNELVEYAGIEILYSLSGESVVNYAYAYCLNAYRERPQRDTPRLQIRHVEQPVQHIRGALHADIFWYMPDPAWKASTTGFTQAKQDLIRKENH